MASPPEFITSCVNLLKRELMEYQRDKHVRKAKLPQAADISFLSLGHPVMASAYVSDCVDQLDEVCRESIKRSSNLDSVEVVGFFQLKVSIDPAEFAESLLDFIQVHVKEHFAALAEQAMRDALSTDMVLFLGSLTHMKIAFMSYEQMYEAARQERSVKVLKKCCRLLHSMILQYSKLTASSCFRQSLTDLPFLNLNEYRDAIEKTMKSNKEVLDILPPDVGNLVVRDMADQSLMLFAAVSSMLRPPCRDADRIRTLLLLSICDYGRLAPISAGKSRLKIVQLLCAAAAIYSPLSSVCQVVFDPGRKSGDTLLGDPSTSWINGFMDPRLEGNLHLQLLELFGQTRADVPKLIYVMISQNYLLSRLIVTEVFRKCLLDCESSFSQFFRCLILICENNFGLWDSVYSSIIFDSHVNASAWEVFSRKEVWVSTKPAWFEAIVAFLSPYTKSVVADIIATLPPPTAKPSKISIKFEKLTKRTISSVTKQLSIIPLGLAKLFVELGRALPESTLPVGGSVALHFGICSVYQQLLNGEGIGTRSDGEFVRNFLLAVAERLCLCADTMCEEYGKQINGALSDRLKYDYCETFVQKLNENNLQGYCTSLHSSLCYRKEDVEALEIAFRLLKRNQGWIERKLNIIQRVRGLDAPWDAFSLDLTVDGWEESLKLSRQIVFASKFPSDWPAFISYILKSPGVSQSGFKEMLANRWEFASGAHPDADVAVAKALKACDNLVK